jgi:hypothetical protein|nr:MAG TPA: hypothetical protein [Caudoviricetes sp.]
MIINIDDTTNLKRIILEFDESSNNSDEEINIINSNSNTTNKTIKPKSRKTTKQDNTTDTIDNTDVPIDFNNYLESTEISQSNSSSQEIIQKPVIPDIDRDVKIADNMQNLKI